MSKLDKIKAELAKLLLTYSTVKTDVAVLEYDGEELKEDMNVYVTDENGERVEAKDGEYKTDDNKVITVANGKVVSIVEVNEEVEEEDKPTEEVTEEVKLEDMREEIDNIHKEINELYKLVDSLLKRVGETRDEADARLKKLECSSQAKPAVEEFEQETQNKKTGDAKLDKFLSKYGK